MSDSPDSSAIDLDFVVESSDLFRAGIKLARTRMVLGMMISLTLVIGLVTFFLMLGEQKILLQTSPLFVGIPLLAVGGQLLRLNASCKQYVRSLSASQRRVVFSFSTTEDTFQVTSGESFSVISWNDVLKVVEDRERFFFYLSKFDARVIPKRAFGQEDLIVSLRKLVLLRLANRAYLLS